MNAVSERDRAVIELLRQRLPDLLAVYRYGTAETRAERPDSDVDVAFLARGPIPAVETFRVAQELAVSLRRDVDLVDLAAVSTVLQAQVVSTGSRIFCADWVACETFEDRVYSAYALLNEERRGILEDIAARGTVYGR